LPPIKKYKRRDLFNNEKRLRNSNSIQAKNNFIDITAEMDNILMNNNNNIKQKANATISHLLKTKNYWIYFAD